MLYIGNIFSTSQSTAMYLFAVQLSLRRSRCDLFEFTCGGDEQPLPCTAGNASATGLWGYRRHCGDGTPYRDGTLD